MGSAKETAEEQLLRMIEGPAGAGRPATGPQRQSPVHQLVQRAQAFVDGLRAAVSGWLRPTTTADLFLWRLRLAERMFWLVLIGLGAYLIVDLLFGNTRLPAVNTAPVGRVTAPTTGPSAEDQLKPLSEYRQRLLARNPFMLSAAKPTTAAPAASSRLAELASALTVVGINRGRVPEALIEDSADQRTHVVKVGDQVNGVTIKAIDQRGVVLSLEDEEIVLK